MQQNLWDFKTARWLGNYKVKAGKVKAKEKSKSSDDEVEKLRFQKNQKSYLNIDLQGSSCWSCEDKMKLFKLVRSEVFGKYLEFYTFQICNKTFETVR